MNTSTHIDPKATEPANDAGCRIDIRIKSQGNVTIYNCTAPGASSEPCPPPEGENV